MLTLLNIEVYFNTVLGLAFRIGAAIAGFVFRKKIARAIRSLFGSPQSLGKAIGGAIGTEAAIYDGNDGGFVGPGGGILVGTEIRLESLQRPPSGKKLRSIGSKRYQHRNRGKCYCSRCR